MTEKLTPLLTQSSAPSRTVVPSPQSAPARSNHVSNKASAPAEEEPYTIKCICDFTDDDGNTIYCDVCDTWQHIECYYPYNMGEVAREDFNHSCVECKPRLLDREQANERQNSRQTNGTRQGGSERKPTKRPPPKGQKRKSKSSDAVGSHGHSTSENNSKQSHDSLPTHTHKKTKSSHRLSQSAGSQTAKRSPSCTQKTSNPHGHPPSPATTPQELPHEFELHNYSTGLMDLYKDDRDIAIVQTNSFASLTIPNVFSAWLRDRDKLKREAGCEFSDVFRSLPPDIDSIKRTPDVLSKSLSVASDTIAHWQYLASPQAVDKDIPLMELNGQIGIQKDYCQDPSNRWQILSAPLPFVFFHPMLPIYIDTRKEGSQARYVRRSCKPNAFIDTFLSDGSEYHFWLVSDRAIKAGEQITIPWQFNLQKDGGRLWLKLLGLTYETDKQPEYNENDTELYRTIAGWVHTLLSEYGGCACDLGPDCAFSRFHQTYIARPQDKDRGSKQKGPRKRKTSNVSPTSTGQATNSRAPSEGQAQEGVDNDSRSSQGRSKPPSRDMTPAPRQGSFDMLGVLTELTDRDKRKVQMVEDSFRRMEQQQQPLRKKKRLSEGTSSGASGTTSKAKSKSTPTSATTASNSVAERRYVDAETSGSIGDSPASAASPASVNPPKKSDRRKSASIPTQPTSQGPRVEYRDASVQTDPVDGEWFSTDRQQTAKRKRRVVSLSKRLLETRYRLRADEDLRRRSEATSMAAVAASPIAAASPTAEVASPTTEVASPTTEAASPASEVASPATIASALVNMDIDPAARDQARNTAPAPETASGEASQPEPTVTSASDDTPMPDAPAAPPADTTTPSSVTNPTSPRPTDVKVKPQELRVQLPPVPAFNSPSVVSSGATPVSAQSSSVVQSPSSVNNPQGSLVSPPPGNGVSGQAAPVKKKLTLSDYTRSRMNKAAAARSSKPPTTSTEETKPPVTDATTSESPVNEKKDA